jgi:hypothetical protein
VVRRSRISQISDPFHPCTRIRCANPHLLSSTIYGSQWRDVVAMAQTDLEKTISIVLPAGLHIDAQPLSAPVMFRLPSFSLPPESSQFMGNRFHVVLTLIWHPEVPFGFTHPLLLLGLCTHYFVLVYAPPPLSYLGLRTHLFIWAYAPTIFSWDYAPSLAIGTMHPHSPLGLCTLVRHWDYAPSFGIGTMHPHLPSGLHTLLFVWVAIAYSLGLRILYFCPTYAPVIWPLASDVICT